MAERFNSETGLDEFDLSENDVEFLVAAAMSVLEA